MKTKTIPAAALVGVLVFATSRAQDSGERQEKKDTTQQTDAERWGWLDPAPPLSRSPTCIKSLRTRSARFGGTDQAAPNAFGVGHERLAVF